MGVELLISLQDESGTFTLVDFGTARKELNEAFIQTLDRGDTLAVKPINELLCEVTRLNEEYENYITLFSSSSETPLVAFLKAIVKEHNEYIIDAHFPCQCSHGHLVQINEVVAVITSIFWPGTLKRMTILDT